MISISIIVPCYNEEATIHQLLDAIDHQSYPLNEVEVIIADGLSTDRTRDVIYKFQSDHPAFIVSIIDNPRRAIPSGLNRAIEASHGKYIVRMDAHSIPNRDYLQNTINGLEKRLGDNVGGVWIIQPGSPSRIAKAIALTASHPLAVGDALYRIGGIAQEVDTVPFGAYRRELIDKIGKYDESLLTNEDYEFNVRVRQAGGKVFMDPSIQSVYYSRSTLTELSRQYWRYGYWKAKMLLRYPKTLRMRQLLPPLFVLSLVSLGLLSIAWEIARRCLIIIVLLYMVVIMLVGIHMSIKHKDISLILGVPMAIATIHLSWGTALIWGLVTNHKEKRSWN